MLKKSFTNYCVSLFCMLSIRKNMKTKLLIFITILSGVLSAQALYSRNDKQICKTRLPESINAFQPAILPVLTVDGKLLFFDRKLHHENIGGTNDLDDIWYSEYSSETSFTKPKNLGKKYNTKESNVLFSITPDGTALIYGTKQSENNYSLAEIDGNEFDNFISIKIDNYYNTAHNFFAYLSGDRQTLLLALKRKDSRGKLDIYVSFRKGDSYVFSEPRNLGKTINTKQTESSPFLAYDNKTLYFSTNGRKGFGGKDLYMTRRLDDTWQNWTEPVNLGTPINTEKDDNGICLTALGDSAIVTSWDKQTMREGMYFVCLPLDLQPEPYIIVAGNVTARNMILSNFDNVDIEVSNDKNNHKEHYKPRFGNKFYCLLPNDVFSPIIVRKKGFDEFGFAVNSRNLIAPKFVYYNASLSKTQKDKIVIGKIYFNYNDEHLNTKARKQIEQAMEKIIEPDEEQVYVIGHTDTKGSEEYNFELSRKRAESVKAALLKYGFKSGNVIVLYKGESEPVSETDEKNRRVEIILIDN